MSPESIWADSAMAMLDKALELDPANPDGYRHKAHIYELLGSEDRVKETLLEGLQHDPDDFLLLNKMGYYIDRLGQQDRALGYFLKSWAVNKPIENEEFYDQFRKMFMEYELPLVRKYYLKGMDYPHVVVFLVPEHRVIAEVHLRGGHNLRVIGQELIPCLFRYVGRVLKADHPVDPVQVGDRPVVLVLGMNKSEQQQDHSQAQ